MNENLLCFNCSCEIHFEDFRILKWLGDVIRKIPQHFVLYFWLDRKQRSQKIFKNIVILSQSNVADDMNNTLETILKRPYSQSLWPRSHFELGLFSSKNAGTLVLFKLRILDTFPTLFFKASFGMANFTNQDIYIFFRRICNSMIENIKTSILTLFLTCSKKFLLHVTGEVRSCVSSTFRRCTPILHWSE